MQHSVNRDIPQGYSVSARRAERPGNRGPTLKRTGTALAITGSMNKSHYFLSSVTVYEGDKLKVALHRALVSRNGVYKVFEESEDIRRTFLEGRIFRVRLDGLEYSARLVRESGPASTHYNLNLFDAGEGRGDRIQALLGKFGFESPWRRGFARIPISNVFAQTEVPVGAVLERFSGTATAEVRNFSYHGLCLELSCASHSVGETVGQRVRFKLMTSRGTVLEACTGKVARIYDEVVSPGKVKRSLGIRLVEMSDTARKAYYGMILDACRELKGGF